MQSGGGWVALTGKEQQKCKYKIRSKSVCSEEPKATCFYKLVKPRKNMWGLHSGADTTVE